MTGQFLLNLVHFRSYGTLYVSLLLPSARRIKEVVDANPLKLMSAIFNRPGQCTYAATCAHSETLPPSLLFCRENSFTPSIHPALLMVEMGPGVHWLHLLPTWMCASTPPFLASRPDPWASSQSQTLPFRYSAAVLSTTHDPAVWLGITGIGHPQMKVLSLFTHRHVF